MAKQNHHPGRRLCIEWHLQFHHTVASPFQVKDVAESHHIAAGTAARCRLSGCHLLLSVSVLDAGIDRLSGRFTASRHNVGRKCGRRQ